MSERVYAYIKKGSYKGQIGLVQTGPLDEKNLQFPESWVDVVNEKVLAKDLIDSMMESRLNEVLCLFIDMTDASRLISKYMGELGQSQFQGGCCG